MNLVAEFVDFEFWSTRNRKLIHVADDSSVGIGEEQLYAFFITPNNVSIGTLAMLRAALEQFAETNPSRSGLILQIKELIGSNQEKKVASSRMRRLLLDAQGTAAARSFL